MNPSCAAPHPKRAQNGADLHPDFDVFGSYITDQWGRCRKCGAWAWIVTDDGKFDYRQDWDLDRELAERAFVGHDAAAAAKLLVTTGLPHGPVWDSSTALRDLFAVITPNATDAERVVALASASPQGLWLATLSALRERTTTSSPSAPPLVFALDVRLDNRTLAEPLEVGESLVLVQSAPTHALVRVDAKSITEIPAAGPLRFLARRDDAVLFGVTTPQGEATVLIDDAGKFFGAMQPARFDVSALDDGWWLFVPNTNEPVRYVEWHKPDGSARVKLKMAFDPGGSCACAPRRMGDGWIVSACVDDDGNEQALTLFDDAFKMIAQSAGFQGQRVIAPINATSLWCETARTPYTLERWERRAASLHRTFDVAVQSWIRIGDGIVVAQRDLNLAGFSDTGEMRFRVRHELSGATYFVKVGAHVLAYDDHVARTLDPLTGEDVIGPLSIEDAQVLEDRNGIVYVKSASAIWIHDGESPKRIYLGDDFSLETSCGDAVLVRQSSTGRCLLVGREGVRAEFVAKHASISVIGARAGPYLLEGDRLRIARL